MITKPADCVVKCVAAAVDRENTKNFKIELNFYFILGYNHLWSTLTVFCMLLIMTVSADESTLLRPHYGAVFRYIGETSPSLGFWHHTILVALPPKGPRASQSSVTCTSLVSVRDEDRMNHCFKIWPSVKTIMSLQNQMALIMNEIYYDISRMIPRLPTDETRRKRSWFPWIGSAMRTVFGTAEVQDIAKIKAHVAEMS